jgi:hypothetical protein
MDEGDGRAPLARRLRTQGQACADIGSPLYAGILEHAAVDAERGGVVRDVLDGHEHDPGPSALALRLLGAVHRMVLDGSAPDLARYYPSAGGNDGGDPWPAFLATVTDRFDDVRAGLQRGVQTNEVGRAGALAPAFLHAARTTHANDLRVLEVGASGGLNLRWDHFAYADAWGDPTSPVQLGDPYEGGRSPFDPTITATVAERAGCDPNPIDVTSDDGALTLMSFVWPDQERRFRDLRGAIDIARRVPAALEKSEAAPWVTERLAQPQPSGRLTIVYHSVVMQYLSDDGRAAFFDAMRAAGDRATSDTPLAWVRFEPARRTFEVRVTTWPGGSDELVAEAGAHGRPVRWLATP